MYSFNNFITEAHKAIKAYLNEQLQVHDDFTIYTLKESL
jgi:hypothetical protein